MSSRRRLWVTLGSLLCMPLVLEGLVRLRADLIYGSTYEVFDLYTQDEDSGRRRPIAGLTMDLTREHRVEFDSQGFRNPELSMPKAEGSLRVAFLGASPVLCVEAPGNFDTWPQMVTDQLAEAFPQRQVDHVNAAVSGYGIEESHARLLEEVAPTEPDVIVIYHATRDLTEDTFFLAQAAGLMERPRRGWLEEHSLLVRLIDKNLTYRRALAAGEATEGKLRYDPEPLAAEFERKLSALVGDAQGIAEQVLLITFAISARRDQTQERLLHNLTHAFTFTPYLDSEGIFAGYEAYNRAVRRVAHRYGTWLLEGPEVLPGGTEYFLDSVHLARPGRVVMAKAVAGLLIAELQPSR